MTESHAGSPAGPPPPEPPEGGAAGGAGTPTAGALEVPVFYGEAAATESMTGIAAPLLAGAAVAITGVVVQQPDALRWPGVTLLLLVGAASLLVAAVQFGFLARRHVATPDERASWWPHLDAARRAEKVRDEVDDDAPLYVWWAELARWAYGLGIVLLWAGLGVAVLPDWDHGQPAWRWAATVVAWTTAAAEVGWFVVSRVKPGWFTPRRAARKRYYR